jgi:hypothetical protein
MFNNLRNALNQNGISIKQYAIFLGIGEKTLQNKLKGITDFTYLEFKKTCIVLLPNYSADYLFAESPPQQTA